MYRLLIIVLLALVPFGCLAGGISIEADGLITGIEKSRAAGKAVRDRQIEENRARANTPEAVRNRNRNACHAIKKYTPLQACLGNCDAITEYKDFSVRQMCLGKCNAEPREKFRMACQGQCGLIKDNDTQTRCYKCAAAGKSVKWATLYALGVVLTCY